MSALAGRRPGFVRRRIGAVVDAVPLVLVVIAEAAWTSVIAGLLQEYVLRQPVLGIPQLVPYVVVGIASARLLGRRLGDRWPVVALGLTAAAALAGLLSSAETRAALGSGDLGLGLAAHPGGWLAAVAFLRGYAYATSPLAEATVARLLGFGIVGLALAGLAGGAIAEPWRGQFLAGALVASIVFATCATLGLAFARLRSVGWDAGLDWRRNPTWAGMLVVLVVAAVIVAIPISTIAGTAIELLLGIAIGPLLVASFVLGFDRTWRRVIGLIVAAIVVVFLLVTFFAGPGGKAPPPVAGVPGTTMLNPVDQVMTVGLGGLVLLLGVVGVLVLATMWMRRIVPPEDGDVAETRWIDEGEASSRPRRRLGRRRRWMPADAVGAYVALIDDLASRPVVRREPAETPAEHARRLRESGRGSLSLDLLAADYGLVRFAGVRLSDGEDRRAISRWQSLRRRLGREDRPTP